MTINIEQFAASNKETVESLLAVANAALATAERVAALNLNTARTVLEDTASSTRAVLDAKTPQEAMATVQSDVLQSTAQKAADYSRALYEISTDSQQNMAKMLEAQYAEFQKQVTGMIDKAAKAAPAGSEPVIAGIQQAINAANAAFGNMNAMAKQFADLAQANVAVATKAVAASAKKSK